MKTWRYMLKDESDTIFCCIAFLYKNTHLPSAMTYSYLIKSTVEKTTITVILVWTKVNMYQSSLKNAKVINMQ